MYTPDLCGRRGCVICSRAGDTKRGKRQLDRMGALGLGIWVFTLPRPFDALVPGPFYLELEKRFRQRLEDLYLTKLKYKIGYRQVWHPTGDRCTHCKYEETVPFQPHLSALQNCTRCGHELVAHPHMNFLIPLLGWRCDKENAFEDPVFEEIDGFLKDSFLDCVKHAWAEEVTRMFASLEGIVDIDLPPMIVKSDSKYDPNLEKMIENGEICVANCHYQYVKKPTDLKSERTMEHRFKYFSRSFPSWEESLKKGILHRGRDYGLLTVAPRGLTKEVRKKYRLRLVYNRSDLSLSNDDMEELNKKPVCPSCKIGTISTVGRATLYEVRRYKNWKRVTGPHYNKDSIPTMEFFTCPQNQRKPRKLLRTRVEWRVLRPDGSVCSMHANTLKPSQGRLVSFYVTSPNV